MYEVKSELWIGNAFDARDLTRVHATGIEAIVDLAMEEPPVLATREIVYSRIPLVDGSGNQKNRIQYAVYSVIKLIGFKIPTLVVCSAGMSRSPAIVAAALALQRNIKFKKVLLEITQNQPRDISPALLTDIQSACFEK